MQTIDTIMGKVVVPDWPKDLIVRALSEQGEWARTEQVLASTMLRDGDAVWDGGAFLGTFGIGISQLAAEAGRAPSRLVAIEPGAELRQCLEANLRALAPCPTDLATFAIALDDVFMVAHPDEDSDANYGGISYKKTETLQPGGVLGRPLSRLREEFGDYDFIKLDLEGGEYDALRSDFAYLNHKKPVIWAECNESKQSLLTLEALVALGYAPQYVAFPTFRKSCHNPNSKPIYAMAYEAVLLATTSERPLIISYSGIADQIIQRRVRTSWDLRQALWATPRWAMEDWLTLSHHELIGMLGKLHEGLNLQDYLTD